MRNYYRYCEFFSSIYMRDIDLFLVPTTLMVQADATTEGKTCINSLSTKNIIGTQYLPKFVYSNINYLDNLTSYEFRQGISEIFKYGLLGSIINIDGGYFLNTQKLRQCKTFIFKIFFFY